jgi:hypothetical protein
MRLDMKGEAETVTTVDLGYEQLFVFDSGPQGRVRVLYGATWLTEEGEPGDAVIGAGAEVPLHGGRTVAEALAPTRLQIVDRRPRGALRRAGYLLRRVARELRGRLDRLQFGAVGAGPHA